MSCTKFILACQARSINQHKNSTPLRIKHTVAFDCVCYLCMYFIIAKRVTFMSARLVFKTHLMYTYTVVH
jgi:hypothetical protein